MTGSATKKLRTFVAVFWMINLFLGLSIFVYWLLGTPGLTGIAKSAPSATLAPENTFPPSPTTSPTASIISTITATFSETPTLTITASETPSITLTPVPFSEGPIKIGSSVKGRDLQVYRFGTGSIERLIVAGIHGGSEYNTIQLADKLIAYLQTHPEMIPVNKSLYILRDLNPDGEARSHSYLGRPNENNVDLNRNWDANWMKEWPRANCWTNSYVSGGSAPMSEPETQALAAFIAAHSFDAIINYHSAALGIFPGGLPPDDFSISLAKAIAAVTTYSYPPINIGCVYSGGFTDWANEKGIAAVDVELTNLTDTDYEMNLVVLNTFLSWKR